MWAKESNINEKQRIVASCSKNMMRSVYSLAGRVLIQLTRKLSELFKKMESFTFYMYEY